MAHLTDLEAFKNSVQLPQDVENSLRAFTKLATIAVDNVRRIIAAQNLDTAAIETALGHVLVATDDLETALAIAREVP